MVVLNWSWLRMVIISSCSRVEWLRCAGTGMDGEPRAPDRWWRTGPRADRWAGRSRRARRIAAVVLLEAGNHLLDEVADCGRSRRRGAPSRTLLRSAEGRPRQPGDDGRLGTELLRGRGQRALRLRGPPPSSSPPSPAAARWPGRPTRSGPSAGRMSAVRAGDEVRAVELGGDVDGEPGAAERLGGERRCRASAERKLPPRAKNTLTRPVGHGLGCSPRCPGRDARGGSKPNVCLEPVEERTPAAARQMPTVRSPWTLLWPADGQVPAPGLPMLPAEEEEVDDLLDVVDGVPVLGEAHRPGEDDPLARARGASPAPRICVAVDAARRRPAPPRARRARPPPRPRIPRCGRR